MILQLWIFRFLLIAFTTSSVSSFVLAQSIPSKDSQSPELLVDVHWLSQNDNEQLRLISIGQTIQEYRAGHIANSAFVDWKSQISDPSRKDLFNLPPREMVESLLSSLGVTPEMTIVISDNLSNRLSTRLFWTLKVYGHANIKILDGGGKAWLQSGEKLTTLISPIEPTVYRFAADNKEWASLNYTDTPGVITSVGNGVVLLDGRPRPQYTGAEPGIAFHTNKPHKRLGHIKTAINVPWKANFTEDGKFKSVEALRAVYAKAGITQDLQIVTYCNEGLHAAPGWFVLKELLGFPDVKLYDDSMGVWANRFDTPMEQTEPLLD